jgi:hypothetical protein
MINRYSKNFIIERTGGIRIGGVLDNNIHRFNLGEITRLYFVKCVAHLYSNVNK